MATTSIFNGSILVLKYDGGIIGHTTSCSISLSTDTPEATSKDSSGFTEYIPGVMSGEISFEGLIKYTDSTSVITLTDALLARNTVTAIFGTTVSGDAVYSASCIVSSIEHSAEMESPATFSGTLTLTGAITKSTNA